MAVQYLQSAGLSISGSKRMAPILESVFGKHTTKRTLLTLGNGLSARVSSSTPVLFISQLNERLTSHRSLVPAVSPVTPGSANCRQLIFSFPGSKRKKREIKSV